MGKRMIGSLTPQQVRANEAVVTKLTLNNVTVENVIEEILKDSDTRGLLTLGSIQESLEDLDTIKANLSEDSSYYQNLTVISQSLTKKYFTDINDWEMTNWSITNGIATFQPTVSNDTNNSILINSSRFPVVGQYYLVINVTALPSGKLELYKNDEWLGTITAVGRYYHEFSIESTASDKIKLVALEVAAGETVTIAEFGVYYVAQRFYEYVLNKVKELATVDATGFVTVENFNKSLEVFRQQFEATTAQYLTKLTEHTSATNPHNITCDMIGASPKDHKHSEYLNTAGVQQIVDEQLKDYSKIGHTHEQYVTNTDVTNLVNETVGERISELISVDPMIITAAPDGILPSRFAQTDISLPLTVLLPTTVVHNSDTAYDWHYGTITTNREEAIDQAPKVFSADGTSATLNKTLIETGKPLNFRICYHHTHKILGYRLTMQHEYPLEWSVYSGNTTFLHRVSDPQNVTPDADDPTKFSCEIFFDEEITADSLSFIISRLSNVADSLTWSFHIELMYNDYDNTSFGVTSEKIQFCVPQSGTNKVVELPASETARTITPDVIVPETPLYIFGRKNNDDIAVQLDYSYIQPEYSTVCRGLDIFVNATQQFIKDDTLIRETYNHAAFGTLTLSQGTSLAGVSLLELYKTGDTSWYSDGQQSQIVIEQTFLSDNIVMKGYQLNWKNADASTIPTSWTLTLEGKDSSGRDIVYVADSVDQYYPFYSVEDDDIVYHAKFDIDMTVKKVILTMQNSNTSNPTMSLNQLGLFVCERYYSIPQNTMYLGLQQTAAMCLGKAIYHEDTGWEVENLCFGTSCVIPVNNLAPSHGIFTEYTVMNPFLSDNVTVSVHSYSVLPSNTVGPYPYTSITSITADKITIAVEKAYSCAVAITRNW